jgi:competence protein CoiA
MKFALVSGQRQESQPNLSGECPCCGNPMVAKCGEVRDWHWAHRGRRHCDSWWENETEWHRDWKGKFPVEWQEIVQHAEDGERHIADVKTSDYWVIEFQHSYIKPEERRSREGFYPKLVWVVDGLRRKTDVTGFRKALEQGTQIVAKFPALKIRSDKGALMRDWAGSRGHVFIDFGDEKTIWWLWPIAGDTWAYVIRVSRDEFIAAHRRAGAKGAHDFESFSAGLVGLVSDYESYCRAQALKRVRPFQGRHRRSRRRL